MFSSAGKKHASQLVTLWGFADRASSLEAFGRCCTLVKGGRDVPHHEDSRAGARTNGRSNRRPSGRTVGRADGQGIGLNRQRYDNTKTSCGIGASAYREITQQKKGPAASGHRRMQTNKTTNKKRLRPLSIRGRPAGRGDKR